MNENTSAKVLKTFEHKESANIRRISPRRIEHDERGVRFGDAGREVGVGEVEHVVLAGGDEDDERG